MIIRHKLLLVSCALFLLVGIVAGCASTSEKPCDPRRQYCPSTPRSSVDDDFPAVSRGNEYGIEIVSLRVTAAGRLVDLRYKIIDSDKAAPVFDRQNKASLIDEASGTVLGVPRMAKVGPLRQTNFTPQADRVYFILFGNPGGLVKTGSSVTLNVGDCALEHLVVQ